MSARPELVDGVARAIAIADDAANPMFAHYRTLAEAAIAVVAEFIQEGAEVKEDQPSAGLRKALADLEAKHQAQHR